MRNLICRQMTNPCYDFALRPQSNISTTYDERRHTPTRGVPSPGTPSSQESIDDIEFSRQRGDRGRWKTDGRVNIAGRYENSNISCHCRHCVSTRERDSHDFLDPSLPRRSRTARKSSLGVTRLGQQQAGGRKPPSSVPKVDHSLWNPMQLLRRPHISTERERETSRLDDSWWNYKSSSSRLRPETSSRSRDARESYSPNRVPHKSSKVRTLRRNPLQPRKLSPHKSSPSGCSSSKTPCAFSSRRSYIDTATLRYEKSDIACQTRRDEFPLTPEETPRASPIRRVIASDSFFYGRPSHHGKTFSCASQRRPSPCRCGAATCTLAAPLGCCCSVGVGWQGRAQCQKLVMAPQTSCQGTRNGNCYAVGGHQCCHQGCRHEMCSRGEPPSVQHGECSKCHHLYSDLVI